MTIINKLSHCYEKYMDHNYRFFLFKKHLKNFSQSNGLQAISPIAAKHVAVLRQIIAAFYSI